MNEKVLASANVHFYNAENYDDKPYFFRKTRSSFYRAELRGFDMELRVSVDEPTLKRLISSDRLRVALIEREESDD